MTSAPTPRHTEQSAPNLPGGPRARPAPPRGARAAEVSHASGPSSSPTQAPVGDQPEFADGDRWFCGAPRIALPSWLISAVAHAVALLILALITIGAPAVRQEIDIVSPLATELEELAEIEIELEPPELQEMQMFATHLPDPGAADFGDLDVDAELAPSVLASIDVPQTTVGEIGVLFGRNGLGMEDLGSGQGAATFFGVRTAGRRFVYVVDNSNSMNNGKFETACAELLRSVGQLDQYQQFYVIFFSDTAYPLFYPQSATGMIAASDENKRKLQYWLQTVQRCLRTEGSQAMRQAFALKPDAIFVLGDGSFTDNTVNEVLAVDQSPATVHTLGFRMRPKAEMGLRQIAKKFKGSFTEVQVTPAMVELSRRMNRPRNRVPNGVWGVKLGQPKRPGKR